MPNLPLGFRRILCRNKIDKADVHAFALRPTVELMKQLSTYTEVAVVAQLRPPCDYSCQGLIYQMYNTNDWQSMFGYQTIISRRGGGAAGPKGGGVFLQMRRLLVVLVRVQRVEQHPAKQAKVRRNSGFKQVRLRLADASSRMKDQIGQFWLTRNGKCTRSAV